MVSVVHPLDTFHAIRLAKLFTSPAFNATCFHICDTCTLPITFLNFLGHPVHISAILVWRISWRNESGTDIRRAQDEHVLVGAIFLHVLELLAKLFATIRHHIELSGWKSDNRSRRRCRRWRCRRRHDYEWSRCGDRLHRRFGRDEDFGFVGRRSGGLWMTQIGRAHV